MKNYVGSKIIRAELSTLNDYRIKKYGERVVLDEEGNKIQGYIVYYPGIGENKEVYISWSPKEVFEKAYREITPEEMKLILDPIESEEI